MSSSSSPSRTTTTPTAAAASPARGASRSENQPPSVVLSRLSRQIRELHSQPPEGVRLVENDEYCGDSLTEVIAELQGPQGTPYEHYSFLIKLVLTDFPTSPPRGFFLTKIFHPNVSNAGAICVNTLSKDWTSSTTLSHVLTVIRCLLVIPFPESSLNEEAGKLFMENYNDYCQRARLLAQVHGRPSLVEESKDMSTNNPLRSSTSSSNAAANNSNMKKLPASKKQQQQQRSKKKSLKRL